MRDKHQDAVQPAKDEVENNFGGVAKSYQTDMCGIATDDELTNHANDKVTYPTPRVAINVINATRRIHHQRQVDRRPANCNRPTVQSMDAVFLMQNKYGIIVFKKTSAKLNEMTI